jgi:hypothetical protein
MFIEIGMRLVSLLILYLTSLPGVPTIRFAQLHAASNLPNLSIVATFFSVMTATTLQCSYRLTDGVLETSVNALWFLEPKISTVIIA